MTTGVAFLIGLFLARLLNPADFGLIGMTTIVIALANTFIDSGFTQALIRKKDSSQTDYSTVFYFNLGVSIFFYVLIFFVAESIGLFFNEPKLEPIIKILGLGIIISSFSIIPRTLLTKKIDFKAQTRIGLISSIVAGIVGITMAFKGFGVWSLVAQTLGNYTISTILLWIIHKWRPSFEFSKNSFNNLFAFGSKLLLSNLLNTFFQQIYTIVIAKYFSAADLGYYNRANNTKDLPSKTITNVVQQVSYPLLASIHDDKEKLKAVYQKLIISTMLLVFILMLNLAAVAEPLVITLIGSKWLPSVVFLQLLCFSAMFYPLQAINLNMLNVQGRSDLFLKLEVIKKILIIPVVFIGIFWGIKIMIIGIIITSIISFFLNSYYSGKQIGYSSMDQLKDVLPSFVLAASTALIVYITGQFLKTPVVLTLLIQIFVGAILVLFIAELFKLKSYIFLKEIIKERINHFSHGKNKK